MNLFCFSLEGSMDSLYEPVPEQHANQESSSGRTGLFISSFKESGRAHDNPFMEVSNLENATPKRKSIRRSISENKGFERKTVNDTTWHESSKLETDSHIRRLCQLKDLNEDDLLLSNNIHTLQGEKLQGISYEVINSSGDPAESMGTLKRLQKLVQTRKPRVRSLDVMKPPLLNLQDEDTTLISCMKLVKSQEKKVINVRTRKKEGMEVRLDSLSASLVRDNTSTGCTLAETWSHNEGEVQMYSSWKPLPENTVWTCVDFEIAQVGPWDKCFHCNHHPHLNSSPIDMDLPHSWVSRKPRKCTVLSGGLYWQERNR